MKAIFSFLGRALGDGENPSSSRVIAVLCVIPLLLVPLVVWASLSIAADKPLEMPGSITGFVSAGVTPLLAFLHMQKREETKAPATTPTGGSAS